MLGRRAGEAFYNVLDGGSWFGGPTFPMMKFLRWIQISPTQTFEHAEDFTRNLPQTCLGRRVFVTKKGFIGLGPAALQSGDRICALSGAAVPMILRPQDDHFVLVGEAYVDDRMHIIKRTTGTFEALMQEYEQAAAQQLDIHLGRDQSFDGTGQCMNPPDYTFNAATQIIDFSALSVPDLDEFDRALSRRAKIRAAARDIKSIRGRPANRCRTTVPSLCYRKFTSIPSDLIQSRVATTQN